MYEIYGFICGDVQFNSGLAMFRRICLYDVNWNELERACGSVMLYEHSEE